MHGLRLRLSSLGSPRDARRLPRAAGRPTCARTPSGSRPTVRERIELNPLRAFDSDDPRTREVMAGAPQLLDRLDADDAEHFAAVRELLDARRGRLRDRSDARARPRLLHAHAVRVHSDALGAQSRRRRRRALRRPGRAARRPADAGHRLGGGHRADRCSRVGATSPPRPPLDLFVALRAARGGEALRARDARRARPGCAAQMELAGRSLQGPAQARRAARRALRRDRSTPTATACATDTGAQPSARSPRAA